MAEVETKAAEETPPVPAVPAEDVTKSAESAEIQASSKQASETQEKSTNDTTKKSADNEAAPPESTAKEGSESKNVQIGRSWNERERGRGGRGGRGGSHHIQRSREHKKNIKSDMTMQEESSDPVAIRKQVEFYFSDSNLLTDRFLFERVGGHSNLPVPISIIHSFKRMRHFQPLSAVVAALKDSTTLDIVDNDSCIQRKYPLPEHLEGKSMADIQKVHEDEAMAKSVYAKGFGEEEPGTQFDIEAFFAEFGATNSVRLRRTYDKTFKGSVFVEFDSEETQKKFLSMDPKPKWKGNPLQIKSKKQYCDEKVEDINAGRIRANANDNRKDNSHTGGKNSDDRDWKTRRSEDQANGFQDRRGHHRGRGGRKGFGSSGQRGRGNRDRRGGGLDRNAEKKGNDFRREEHNDHNPKAPTIQPTNDQSSPAPDQSSEQPKPDTLSKITPSTADETKVGDVTARAANNDQPRPTLEEAEPNSTAPALVPPNTETKKRHREENEGATIEETASKARKIEGDVES